MLRANAVAPGIPSHDLILPQEALVALDDPHAQLVPAGALLNGTTLARRPPSGRIVWHSLALDVPTAGGPIILLAENLPVATTAAPGRRLPPGAALLAYRAGLAKRAARPEFAPPAVEPPSTPFIEDDPARPLRLFIESREIEAAPASTPTRLVFPLPPGTGPVRLHSPAHAAPAPQDTRRLGVCITALQINGQPLPLDSPALGPGFHPAEGEAPGQWRWTNGGAWLVLPASNAVRMLSVDITEWHRNLK